MDTAPSIYNRSDLSDGLRRFENSLNASDLKPSASASYIDYAARFVRWLQGDYRPRNAGRDTSPCSSGPWTADDLQREADRYKTVLQEARLRPTAIQTYVHGANVFIRWLEGRYEPRRRMAAAGLSGGLTRPEELASELGVSGLRVRNYLRARYSRDPSERGVPWYLTDEQAAEIRQAFTNAGVRGALPTSAGAHPASDVPTDWFWEGRVQDAVLGYLSSLGWNIDHVSDTATRAQGYDIAASRGPSRLIVEVKGYPSIGYRDPGRASEVKRTAPSLQAKHWFADALLKAVRLRGTLDVAVAIAFPNYPRYLSLLDETRTPLAMLQIGVLVVAEAGDVEEFLPLGS